MNKLNQSNRCSCQYEPQKSTPEIENLLSDMHFVIKCARQENINFESSDEFLRFIYEHNYDFITLPYDAEALAYMVWKGGKDDVDIRDAIYDACANALAYFENFDHSGFLNSSVTERAISLYIMKSEYLDWYNDHANPVKPEMMNIVSHAIEAFLFFIFYNIPGLDILRYIGATEPEF